MIRSFILFLYSTLFLPLHTFYYFNIYYSGQGMGYPGQQGEGGYDPQGPQMPQSGGDPQGGPMYGGYGQGGQGWGQQ